MHWSSRNTRAKRAFCSHTAICSHIRCGVIQKQNAQYATAKRVCVGKRSLHAYLMSSQTLFCTVPIYAHLCLHKSLLVEQLLEGLVAVRTEVNALALVAVFVENYEIRIMMIYPIHFKELVVLETFFLPKETAHLRELVELSPRARLEATVSRLIRVQLFAYAFLALTIRCASLRLALCPRGGQGAQQHSAHKDSAVPHL